MIRSHDSCVPRKTKMLIIILLENRSRHYVNIRIVFVKVFVYLFILYICSDLSYCLNRIGTFRRQSLGIYINRVYLTCNTDEQQLLLNYWTANASGTIKKLYNV